MAFESRGGVINENFHAVRYFGKHNTRLPWASKYTTNICNPMWAKHQDSNKSDGRDRKHDNTCECGKFALFFLVFPPRFLRQTLRRKNTQIDVLILCFTQKSERSIFGGRNLFNDGSNLFDDGSNLRRSQSSNQFSGTLKAIVRVLGQHSRKDLLRLIRDTEPERVDRRRCSVLVRVHDGQRTIRFKWRSPRQQEKPSAPQAVKIRTNISMRWIDCLFRSHVIRCADNCPINSKFRTSRSHASRLG